MEVLVVGREAVGRRRIVDDARDGVSRRDRVGRRTGHGVVVDRLGQVIRILRIDGSEIDNLQLLENFPGIEWTEIEVNQEGLEARIREIQEPPTSGEIIVHLNDRSVSVDTSLYFDAFGVTHGLMDAINAGGFAAFVEPPWIIVTYDLQENVGLTKVGLVSTDPSIVASDITPQK